MSSSKGAAPDSSPALKTGDPKKTQEPPLPKDGKGNPALDPTKSAEQAAIQRRTPCVRLTSGGHSTVMDDAHCEKGARH